MASTATQRSLFLAGESCSPPSLRCHGSSAELTISGNSSSVSPQVVSHSVQPVLSSQFCSGKVLVHGSYLPFSCLPLTVCPYFSLPHTGVPHYAHQGLQQQSSHSPTLMYLSPNSSCTEVYLPFSPMTELELDYKSKPNPCFLFQRHDHRPQVRYFARQPYSIFSVFFT